jgi:hypothetical protein
MKSLQVYVAGKVSKDSVFGTHHWRDGFCEKLTELSGIQLHNLDPTKIEGSNSDPETIFKACCRLIQQSDVAVVYLSDDISVGGSQEILIAKYFKKPVIGLAPKGGKFNGSTKEYFGQVITDFKDPFVFSTCDVVCGTVEEVAAALKTLGAITPKSLDIIQVAVED